MVEGEQADRPTDSQIRASSAAQALRRKVTDKATIQRHELINLEPMHKLPNRPMVELEAQSNVWYSARVVKESASEIKLQIGELAAGLTQHCGKVSSCRCSADNSCSSAACCRRLLASLLCCMCHPQPAVLNLNTSFTSPAACIGFNYIMPTSIPML